MMSLRPLFRPTLRFALTSLALTAAFGCKPEYPACKKDKHCNVEAGEKCVDEVCQNCVTDEDCVGKGPNGENLACIEFRCSDGTAAASDGPGSQGSPCTSSIECSGGLVCKSGICDVCTEDFDCAGGTCNLETGRCDESGAAGAGQCQSDDECAIDEICDGGMCVFSGAYGGDGEVLCNLQAIFFGFDSPKILPEAQEQLKAAAQCITDSGRGLILEAHADPRGTEEYNILLTDKRGQGVKAFLVDLGVPTEKVTVISKGSLEAQGSDEASWSQDRRVEFIPNRPGSRLDSSCTESKASSPAPQPPWTSPLSPSVAPSRSWACSFRRAASP